MNHHSPELTAAATDKPEVVITTPEPCEPCEPCEQCGKPFTPRHGGKPQLFCSETCRMAFHREAREADKATLATLRERGTLETPSAATMTPEPPPAATGADAFDWADDESVILRKQPLTAAYFNRGGDLVIRQHQWPDDDTMIFIAGNCIGDFIDKLTDVVGIPSFGKP